MNNDELYQLIIQKTEYQTLLNERKKRLEKLNSELFSSKFSRSFRGFYYIIKRISLIIISVILIIGALFIYFYPEIIFENHDLKEELINEYKDIYYESVGENIATSIQELVKNGNEGNIKITTTNFVSALDKSIEKTAESEILGSLKFLAMLIFFFAIILLYISRLTKKLKLRNSLINKSDSLTQDIIADYKNTIYDMEKELEVLQSFLDKE